MNSTELNEYKCSKCGTCYTTKSIADKCCDIPKKVCEDCGCELDPKSFYTACASCREKHHYASCRKMSIEEYEQEFPGNMVVAGDDNYYASVEEALEYYADNDEDGEVPHYVYGTKKIYAEVDIDLAVERALENAYEDAEFDNLDELFDFVNKWNERNRLTMYEEAKIVIDIPEEIRKGYCT